MSLIPISCIGFTVYLLFAGQLGWHEAATGVVLASLVAAWAQLIRATSQHQFSFMPGFIRPLLRGLRQIVPASLATANVLTRVAAVGGAAGHDEIHYFAPGRTDGAAEPSVECARRACAVLLASYAPDRFVINVDRHSATVLIHSIVPGERELDPRWLI